METDEREEGKDETVVRWRRCKNVELSLNLTAAPAKNPPLKLPAIYNFITSPGEHAVYFLYQHI